MLSSPLLQIRNEDECALLGGTWDICPKNDCQESEAYDKGAVVCPEVCGEPRCDGIIPIGDEDLSSIQNPAQNSLPLENIEAIESEQSTAPTAAEQSTEDIIALSLTLILALVLLYLVLKPKRDEKSTTAISDSANNS